MGCSNANGDCVEEDELDCVVSLKADLVHVPSLPCSIGTKQWLSFK